MTTITNVLDPTLASTYFNTVGLPLEHDGCTIRYWLDGKVGAPLVVLTHGAGLDHRSFDDQVAALSGRYRVLTWDVRGHGLSQPSVETFSIDRAVDDLVALMDSLGYDDATLVGHSMGGNIHQQLGFRHPGRVRGQLVVGCTCTTVGVPRRQATEMGMVVQAMRVPSWEHLKRRSAGACSTTDSGRVYVYAALSQMTKSSFIDVVGALGACPHDEPDHASPVPILIVHGAEDETADVAELARSWAAREPFGRYAAIPSAGHLAMRDNPEAFTRVLIDFLDDVA